MKKVCFVADRFFWEEEMDDLLYQEIDVYKRQLHTLSGSVERFQIYGDICFIHCSTPLSSFYASPEAEV